jgi:hypothetical protein
MNSGAHVVIPDSTTGGTGVEVGDGDSEGLGGSVGVGVGVGESVGVGASVGVGETVGVGVGVTRTGSSFRLCPRLPAVAGAIEIAKMLSATSATTLILILWLPLIRWLIRGPP